MSRLKCDKCGSDIARDLLVRLDGLVDRQEAAVEALEQGVATALSRLNAAILELQIHKTLDDAERNRGRR